MKTQLKIAFTLLFIAASAMANADYGAAWPADPTSPRAEHGDDSPYYDVVSHKAMIPSEREVGPLEEKQFPIPVIEDVIINELALDINLVTVSVSQIEITLTSPTGIKYKVLDGRCGGAAIAFGHRGYGTLHETIVDQYGAWVGYKTTGASDVNWDNPSPKWYRFADDGAVKLGPHSNSGRTNDA